MSNKFEIQQELADAQNELTRLCHKEAKKADGQKITATITIKPRYGKAMNDLREKCSQLRMILDAMEASED
ncbi:hypothetical protein ABTQ33_08080 [Paucilactobacillus suebicus]|uniref:Uncharacterized protein n=1 Tax=Paucilactobacillus suebicus DSM 5007 = KCTC 3549 TaxID=1423807 RepID=A0A0R1W9I6_9LACO|nr:hypothetical protein [Paucilactobacillus suebicus]KRM12532.1 hypothetical protein FD16_GL002283 [Paucilactobacillus suebicus DSM 5007 = KCTC 3549]